mmetsp:Transcript_114193/g.262065  ORF Transcript_114193/g.262065 Transcript_114193/m.262065 type:complete len:117 (-) Transcript_114193:4-354(-)
MGNCAGLAGQAVLSATARFWKGCGGARARSCRSAACMCTRKAWIGGIWVQGMCQSGMESFGTWDGSLNLLGTKSWCTDQKGPFNGSVSRDFSVKHATPAGAKTAHAPGGGLNNGVT